MKTGKFILFICFVLLFQNFSLANQAGIPAELTPWKKWVLYGKESRLCPFFYTNSNHRLCAWPEKLELKLSKSKGNFSQNWQLFKQEWIQLPGNKENWPINVKVNNKKALVVERFGYPAILLGKGKYQISGSWNWNKIPVRLKLPQITGLLKVSLNKNPLNFPELDNSNWLNLRSSALNKQETKNQLRVNIFRKLSDTLPFQVTTRVRLEVAGAPREISRGDFFLKGSIPLSVKSSLPIKVEPNGLVRLLVKPGQWELDFTARYPQKVKSVELIPAVGKINNSEFWSFKAEHKLRVVKINGGRSVDPQQTSIPKKWRKFPAYLVKPGEELSLTETKRGLKKGSSKNLVLDRKVWLDFDGSGYTVRDKIKGSLISEKRLELQTPLNLGSATINGEQQLITKMPDSKTAGIELRKRELNLVADSRIDQKLRTLPAVGWLHDFYRVNLELNLPPGWKLWAVQGADSVRKSWLGKWGLLDYFTLFLIAIATLRLWNPVWAVVAFIAVTLSYHESGVPVMAWLNLLAVTGLLRVVTAGKFQRLIKAYRVVSLVFVSVMLVTFSIQELRSAIYPQLNNNYYFSQNRSQKRRQVKAKAKPKLPSVSFSKGDMMESKMAVPQVEEMIQEKANVQQLQKNFVQNDSSYLNNRIFKQQQQLKDTPSSPIQTGPGVPAWNWNKIRISWNGAVDSDQEFSLWLTSPFVNMLITFLEVILLFAFLIRMFDFPYNRKSGFDLNRFKQWMGISLLICSFISVNSIPAEAAIPSQKILKELEQRLLKAPACMPNCADTTSLRLNLTGDTLSGWMEFNAYEKVAIPLPGENKKWLPQKVQLAGREIAAQLKRNGQIWILLPKGRNQIFFEGKISAKEFQLPLPLKPHKIRVKAPGWKFEGLKEDGTIERQLLFSKIVKTKEGESKLKVGSSGLMPFLKMNRNFNFGLKWGVTTRISRVNSAKSAVSLRIPLLKDESVITPGFDVVNNELVVSLAAGEYSKSWRSVLSSSALLKLQASTKTNLIENWNLKLSPLWHMETSGIPASEADNFELAENSWRPWPGESLTLKFSRPEAVKGSVKTVSKTNLKFIPSGSNLSASLDFDINSSLGTYHQLILPKGAELDSLKINGKDQDFVQKEQNIKFLLNPGKQKVLLKWHSRKRQGVSFTTPTVDLQLPSVNNNLSLKLPERRWVLFTSGPLMGPAVLFWSKLLIFILISLGLGKLKFTPLKWYHWILLSLGLVQVEPTVFLTFAAWLVLLGWRAENFSSLSKTQFNTVQLLLGFLTLASLSGIIYALKFGLTSVPSMDIVGNGSSSYQLNWYQDRAGGMLPEGWVFSLPIWAYRAFMLAWAIWFSFSILNWLRWGWDSFSKAGIWRPLGVIFKKSGKEKKESKIIESTNDMREEKK